MNELRFFARKSRFTIGYLRNVDIVEVFLLGLNCLGMVLSLMVSVLFLFLFPIFLRIFLYFLCASLILLSLIYFCNRSAFTIASYISCTFLHKFSSLTTNNLFIINCFCLFRSSLSSIIVSPSLK